MPWVLFCCAGTVTKGLIGKHYDTIYYVKATPGALSTIPLKT
jgi:hypothetical protein